MQNEVRQPGDPLRTSLLVAEAALDAGLTTAARRLYLSLAERFDDAPEPVLGLAYIEFHAEDYAGAKRRFFHAAKLARGTPAVKAEALLGAGRSALAQGDVQASRKHFLNGIGFGRDLPSWAWIANGLAVSATLDGDYDTAEARYVEAVRRSSDHPRIAANLVRMLIAAGRIDDADRMYAERDPAYWNDDDGPRLSRLIEKARRDDAGSIPSGSPSPVESGMPPVASGLVLRLFPSGAAPSDEQSRVELSKTPILALRLADLMGSSRPSPEISPPAANASPPVAPSDPGQAASAISADDLPWPDPLTLALGQSSRLRLEGDATSVLVAAPEIADVQLLSPNLLFVIGKAIGRTSVSLLGEDGTVQEQVVSVVPDLEPVRTILAGQPDLRGVRAERVLRGIVLTGEVGSAASADRALRLALAEVPEGTPVENELRIVDSQQVNLEVQIAEVRRSITEDLGINWEALHAQDDAVLGFRIGRALTATGQGAVGSFIRAVIDGHPAPSASFSHTGGRTKISGMIDALANSGLANVLARPNVTAVSGKSASFFSGGEYPLPTGFEDGVIVFEYKKYGVLLDFVPTVIDAERISLTVRPEVSEPSLDQSVRVVGIDVPVINVRRAETTVEVGDGESIVIAGLFRNASNTTESGVPVLKDVPGVGMLFGSTSIRSNELELIVVVTARLVRPGPAPEPSSAPLPPRRISGYYY